MESSECFGRWFRESERVSEALESFMQRVMMGRESFRKCGQKKREQELACFEVAEFNREAEK